MPSRAAWAPVSRVDPGEGAAVRLRDPGQQDDGHASPRLGLSGASPVSSAILAGGWFSRKESLSDEPGQ